MGIVEVFLITPQFLFLLSNTRTITKHPVFVKCLLVSLPVSKASAASIVVNCRQLQSTIMPLASIVAEYPVRQQTAAFWNDKFVHLSKTLRKYLREPDIRPLYPLSFSERRE